MTFYTIYVIIILDTYFVMERGIHVGKKKDSKVKSTSDKAANVEEKNNITENKNAPTYKILQYCKKEASVAIACVSALAVILSFLLNMAIYVNDWFFLRYWNIESVYISISTPSQIYRIIGNVVYVISVIIAFSLISSAYEKSIPTKKVFYFLEIKRKQGQISEILTKIKRIIKREKDTLRTNPATQGKIKGKMMRELAEFCLQESIEFDKIQRILTKQQNEKNMLMLSAGIFSTVASIAFALLETDLMGNNGWHIWFVLVFLILIMMGIFYVICYFAYNKKVDRDEIKNKTDEDMRAHLNTLLDTDHERLNQRRWWVFFSDSNIALIIISTILYVLMFFFILGCLSNRAADEMHSFPIVYVEEQSYAVIYNTGENVILEECGFFDSDRKPVDLEKADLSDTIIDINTNKQRIVKIEGLSLHIVEFRKEKVSRNGDIFAQKPTNESEMSTTIPIE